MLDFVLLGSFVIGKAALSFISTVEVRRACENFAARLKVLLFESLLKRDIAFYDAASTGEVLSLISSDVREMKVI